MSRFLMPRNNKASKKRAEANVKHREAIKQCEAFRPMMQKYDTSGSGKLERDQLVKLLTDIDYSTPPGTAPEPLEVDYILQVADMRHNGAINIEELPRAMAAWKSYQEQKPSLERFLAKHDENKSGGLDKDQLRAWLVDLNHGDAVDDADVEHVWRFAHVHREAGEGEKDLHLIELSIAINCWFHQVEEHKAQAAAAAEEERRKSQKGKSKPFARFLMPRMTKISKQRGDANKFYKDMLAKQEKFLASVNWDKYDTNKTGALEKDQLKEFLTDNDSTTPPGTPPTETELMYILQVADTRRNEAINKDELANALTAWYTYKQYAEQLDRIMKKYDDSGTGGLNKAEVKAWLTDLNGKHPVSDEEAETIVRSCDTADTGDLRRCELLLALQTWFVGHTVGGAEPEVTDAKPSESACCVAQ